MACGPAIILLGPADKRGGISWNQEIVSDDAEYDLSIARTALHLRSINAHLSDESKADSSCRYKKETYFETHM